MRTCLVKGKKAKFHRWIDRQWIVAPAIALGGHNGGQLTATFGLIEYEDGTMDEVYPSEIKFIGEENAD